MTSIFIGIIILINAISIGNSHRFDLTGLSQFSLTPQTQEVLNELETPIEVMFFYGIGSDDDIVLRNYVESLLGEYKRYTNLLNVKFIDTDEQPDLAREYSIYQYSIAVVVGQDFPTPKWIGPQEL